MDLSDSKVRCQEANSSAKDRENWEDNGMGDCKDSISGDFQNISQMDMSIVEFALELGYGRGVVLRSFSGL